MTPRQKEIRAAVEKHGGVRAAARALGLSPGTVSEAASGGAGGRRIRTAKVETTSGGVAGSLSYRRPVERPLPQKGRVARYIVTCAQINTDVHAEFWRNLQAYATHFSAEILVARLTYDQRAFRRPDLVKTRAAVAGGDGAYWYADEVLPYLTDARIRLAPGLQFAGELNILPTAVRPLTGLAGYTGRDSTIVPHTRLALESVPTGKNEDTKFLYTTGAVTLRNYIQKRVGQLAEFHHAYCALLVEVEHDGTWFVRQLNATSDGSFRDLDRLVADGRVTSGERVAGIQWGDIHASEMPDDIRAACWGKGGVIDTLRPEHQFFHDLLSFRSQSHHEQKSARKRFIRHYFGQDDVQQEVFATRGFLRRAERPWCRSIVVPSNHDEHADRWLDEGDPRSDPANSALWHKMNARYRDAVASGDLSWSCAREWFGERATVLARDQSFVLHDIEMGWHGDRGPNGSRGTTANLSRTCRRLSKGHDHCATILDGTYSAGVCAYTLDYAVGPSSWSVSHTIVHQNGKRQIITQRGRGAEARYWARATVAKRARARRTK